MRKSQISLLITSTAALSLVLLLTGCETTSEPPPSTNTTALTGKREIPWNQPQSWEGLGVLGGYSENIGTR